MIENTEAKMTKINLGSNKLGLASWINIDNHIGLKIGSSKTLTGIAKTVIKLGWLKYKTTDVILEPPPNLLFVDLTKGKIPFKDNTVNYVYTSHFLEHLYRWQALALLKECHRVMRHEGWIRVVVPDLEVLARQYIAYKEGQARAQEFWDTVEDKQTPTQKVNILFGHYPNKPARGVLEKQLKRLFPNEHEHKWLYDFEDMKNLLEEAGFVNITRTQREKGKVPDLDKLEAKSHSISLFVEAKK